ncbi:MAG: flagellar hook-length control protein FliK, partial [Actinomycetota bacterium]|nr:flagellar hook-length control protein FliK [Actinomycetota bacterium]
TGETPIAGPRPAGLTPPSPPPADTAAATTPTAPNTPAGIPASTGTAPADAPPVDTTASDPAAAPASTGARPDPAAADPTAGTTSANPVNPAAAPGVAPDGAANPGALGQPGPAGVAGPQATAPAAPAAGTPPPPASSPAFQPPAAQLAMRIVPLRLDADGVHRLTVNLHPADLGPVQVVAEIRNGEINVQLTSGTDAGNEALRNALDDLRRELDNAGFRNTSLDLRQGNAQQEQARQQFAAAGYPGGRRDGGPGTAGETTDVPTIRPAAPGSGRLDTHA